MKYIVRDRSFYAQLVKLGVPMIFQSIINVCINITDTLMLSKMDESQISASSLAGNYMSIFTVFCMGLGFGASVMTSQFWGDKDKHGFRSVMTIMIRISFVMGLLFTAITLISPRTIMQIYTDEVLIIEAGTKYLEVVAYSFFFVLLYLPMSVVVCSAHKAVIPLIATICSFMLNIFFNWVFIFGNLGAPRMEIAGAALGTLIAYIFEAVFIFTYLFVFDKDVGYRPKHLFLKCRSYLPRFLSYSAPVILSDSILAVGTSILSVIMGHISGSFVAACAIITVITRLTTIFCQGLSSAATVIVGNTVGRGDKERAMEEGVTSSLLSVLVAIFAACLVLLIGKPYISFYEVGEGTKAIAHELLYASAIHLVFMTTAAMLTKGVLRAGGDTKYLVFLDVIFLWVVSLPLGYLAGFVFHLPPFWIFICLHFDSPIKMIFGFKRLYSEKWIHMMTKANQQQIV